MSTGSEATQPEAPATATKKLPLKWSFALFFIGMHVGAMFAPLFFSWSALVTAVALNFLFGAVGVSIGYHRYLTHRSFKVPKWFEYALAVCGILALQGAPTSWVGMHRMHHAKSDTPADPHDSRRGFWWSHCGWMFYLTQNAYRRYAPRYMQEARFYRFFDRSFLLQLMLQLPLALILFAIGGWSMVFWGVFVRIILLWHCTFLVNSATHKWGYKNYPIDDESRNTWWVAIVSYGEGWHNNHHAQQRSAKFGRRWWEFDVSWQIVRLFAALGLIYDIVPPGPRPR